VCFRLDAALRRVVSVAAPIAAAATCAAAILVQAKELSLSIGDLQTPVLSAQLLRAHLAGPDLRQFVLDVDRITVAGHTWRKVKLGCSDLQVAGARIACSRGMLDIGGKFPVSFSYLTDKRDLAVEFKPAPDESWRIAGRIDGKQTALKITIDKGRLDRLSTWLPIAVPKVSAGRASGTIDIQGIAIKAQLEIEGVGFADESGLHAGEKIAGTLEANAVEKNDQWRWTARFAWRGGEVFWQPLFLAATDQRLRLEGVTARGKTQVREGILELPSIGTVTFNARFDHAASAIESFEAHASRVRVAPLYEQLLKPLLQQTALSDLRADGEATIALAANQDTVTSVDLDLVDVSIEDRQQRRFALFGLNGRIPWRRNEASLGEIAFKGAEFLKLPLGGVRVPLRMRGSGVAIDSMRLPILDGALQLRNFSAAMADDGWRFRFRGEIEPISMTQLTQALAMPVMYGSLSGVIPEVRYSGSTMAMDGTLVISAFDGKVSASKVELIEPFGRAPRLHGDVDMKALDLELLTRTFDFGTITGRIDMRVRDLELVDWQPVRFDASIESSPGKYPKRISQRAVQNISALGGAGAAAAIQRSFLRFFEQFGYDKIGLRCRLNNGVCEMDGVERGPQGYVIVKGGGIPAISVIGYNRYVSWRELVDRLKRITQENVKPVVK
jgi:hypothetical protein